MKTSSREGEEVGGAEMEMEEEEEEEDIQKKRKKDEEEGGREELMEHEFDTKIKSRIKW